MKTPLVKACQLLGLAGVSIALTGCIVAIGGSRSSESAPPPVIVNDSPEAATVAEINAAAKLHTEEGRMQALSEIAGRATLAPATQVQLSNAAYRSLRFDDSKTQVLSKIIARPDFSDAARNAIVSQLNKLSFDANRQMILSEINKRLTQPPTH